MQAVVRAHVWLRLLSDGTYVSVESLARAIDLHPKVTRRAIRLAFLSPAVTKTILDGQQRVLYRYGPSRSEPKWRWITWGSAFAAVSWIVVSILFSWYTVNFGTYNKTYGSLGAAVGFMVWIWLSTAVILIGAELDAEMEHQTTRDTTSGRPKKSLGT